MRSGLQGLVDEVIGYGMGTAVNRILGIAVACIYPVLLNRDEYGRMDVIFSVPTLLTVLFLMGFDSTLARFFYEQKDEARRKRLVSTAFYAVVGFAVVVAGILLLVSRPLALMLYNDPRYVLYFRLVLTSMPFLMASQIQMIVFRLERRVHFYNVFIATSIVINALVGIGSILVFHIGVAGVLLGSIAGPLTTSAFGFFINRRYFSHSPMLRKLPELLSFGLPLMFSGVAIWFIGYINRPMLAHRVSADDLGLFAIASGGVNVMALLIGAFRNAWQPFAFSIMEHEDSGNLYGHTLTLFTFIGAMIAVCGSLFAPQALLLINAYTRKNWSGAAVLVGPLAIGVLFNAMYYVVQTGIHIARRTNVIPWTVGTAALVGILSNAMLIPRYGTLGAAFSTTLGHLTALAILYLVAQRINRIPYQPGRLAAVILSAAGVIFLDLRLQTGSIGRDLAVKIALLLAFGALSLAVRAVTLSDLSLFWNGTRSALAFRNRFRVNREELHADNH